MAKASPWRRQAQISKGDAAATGDMIVDLAARHIVQN